MYKEIKIDLEDVSGDVVLHFNDMTELDSFDDNSVGFVWSGQSIEHVSKEAGEKMCRSVHRVLKEGGAFCLDTPNRLLTQIHTRDVGGGFIHPEHFIEYTPMQLDSLLRKSGFFIAHRLGVREMLKTAQSGIFFYEDFVAGAEISENIEASYIQYFHCLKMSH
ncbi:methyltransferase domain-containing protein [Variovorax robiniae]|uniref:Methyltransferase domain-containing protein n=1 Tax=Variovorax robiniae TaxID=1836199 RepID=A0ABU8X4L4_9BURK